MAKVKGKRKVTKGRDSQGHSQGHSHPVGEPSFRDQHQNSTQVIQNPKSKFSTQCFSTVICIILVPSIALLLKSFHDSNLTGSEFKQNFPDLKLDQIESHQRASLFEPYSLDFEEVLRLRAQNMKKYDYDYNEFGIDRRTDLSLQEYKDVYDGKWPVIITDVIETWKAANWSSQFFFNNYGKERVTMKAVDNSLENAVTLALPLELFYKNTHKAYPNQWTYVEDELFIPMRPELRGDIGDCMYLEDDFFQLFPEEIRPWNAMLLWGTKHSRSSLHMDPYNWTGTNAVLQGLKHWKMYLPGQDHLLYIKENRKSGFPLDCYKYNSPIDAVEPDLDRYTAYKDVKVMEFDQFPGELLIIPTGWYHQAYNKEETIAISSQVMNLNNFRVILEEIFKVGNLDRRLLPRDIDAMSPAEQVKTVMSLLPQDILTRGQQVTLNILQQIQEGHKKTGYQVPFQ